MNFLPCRRTCYLRTLSHIHIHSINYQYHHHYLEVWLTPTVLFEKKHIDTMLRYQIPKLKISMSTMIILAFQQVFIRWSGAYKVAYRKGSNKHPWRLLRPPSGWIGQGAFSGTIYELGWFLSTLWINLSAEPLTFNMLVSIWISLFHQHLPILKRFCILYWMMST